MTVNILDLIVDNLFIVDLVLNFITGYDDEEFNIEVRRPTLIAKNYL